MKRLTFDEAEIADPQDFTAIGTHALAATDAVTGGALGWPAHWARITVSQKTADVVTVSTGDYHAGEPVYRLFEASEINLQAYKPVIATDERWVALIMRGSEITATAIRAFETSEEPLAESVPVNRATPKEIARQASIVVQQGPISPAPALRPTINEDDCCIAFVRLLTTGIAEIVANEAGRVKTVYEIEGRLVAVEVRVEKLFRDTEAITTDVAAIAAKLKGVPSKALVSQITNDVSMLRRLLQLPDAARNYWFDQGLVSDAFWDLGHVNSVARVREGVRFQYSQQRDDQLRLLDPADAGVTIYNDRMILPKYEEATRIESPVGDRRQDISNTVHTVTTAHTGRTSTTTIRYGETIFPCENTAGWEAIGEKRPGEIFSVSGKEYVSLGKTDNPWNQSEDAKNGHAQYAAQHVIRDTQTSTYTYYVTETFGLNGAIYAQTFLCAQMFVATSVELYFTRVGATGDVTLCLCEVDAAGAPAYDAVIAVTVKPRDELVAATPQSQDDDDRNRVEREPISGAWNRFAIPPTLLEPGKRYAFFTVTTGNHQVACNSGNTFTGGTKFACTDGLWSQGSAVEDFAFRINGAKFARSRTVVPFESISLSGGMTEIEMVYEGWEPPGTSRVWEVRPQGGGDWVAMDDRDPNPLGSLPPLVQLRLVMIGTQDVAPMIVIDPHSRVVTGRPRPDMQAISKSLPLGFSTDTFQLVIMMDNFDAAHHTVAPKLMIGATVETADAVVATVDPLKPSRTRIVADFTTAAPATAVRARVDAATDNVVRQPFIQDIQLNAF